MKNKLTFFPCPLPDSYLYWANWVLSPRHTFQQHQGSVSRGNCLYSARMAKTRSCVYLCFVVLVFHAVSPLNAMFVSLSHTIIVGNVKFHHFCGLVLVPSSNIFQTVHSALDQYWNFVGFTLTIFSNISWVPGEWDLIYPPHSMQTVSHSS